MQVGQDIENCNNGERILIGDWGKLDPDIKLQRCANEVKNNPSCGDSFFFRPTKGRCFCEGLGATCLRIDNIVMNEYKLYNGELLPFK